MQIKYLSLNTWKGGILMEAMLKFFKQEDADILALQEVYNGTDPNFDDQYRTVEVLQRELKYPYYDFARTFLDKRSIGLVEQGNAVFSKFPIVDSRATFYIKKYSTVEEELDSVDETRFKNFITYPRNLQYVVLDTSTQKINVFNTHGVWGFDGKDNKRRLTMSQVIIDQVKDKNNVILSGDFNVWENTKTIKNIERHLKNVFKGKLECSFNLKRKTNPNYAGQVVDMMFVSNNFQIVDQNSPEIDVSDHLPLVAVFEI